MIKIAVFASGSGTNAENIAQYFSKSNKIQVKMLLCNVADAYVLERMKKFNIPCFTFSKKELNDPEKVLSLLKANDIDFIVLAGFLLLMPSFIVEAYPKRIVNIHPALLPLFGGKGMYGHHVHEAVVTSHQKESGITIHYVNEKFDSGDTIFQAKCKVEPNDTADDVAAKIHILEQANFPRVIEQTILNNL